MSNRPPGNSVGPLDHLSLRYLRQALAMHHPADEPYVLNDTESRVIRRAKVITLIITGLLGVLGPVLFYWPQYSWPDLFEPTTVFVSGSAFNLPLVTILYGLLLVYTETNLLLVFNQWGVQMIMDVCNFPRAHDAQYGQHVQAMADTARKKSLGGFLHFSLDPYLMLPRWGLPLFFLLAIVKALFSALALNFVLKTLFVADASQAINMAGLPLYAFWNLWASWQVLHETQVRVMAPATIRGFINELHDDWGKHDQFKPLLLETLRFMGAMNRQHNYAHYILTETLIDRFNLLSDTRVTGQFQEHIIDTPPNVRRSLERLAVFCALIDGRLSGLEKQRLHSLRRRGILTYSTSEIRQLGVNFNRGKGLWV